MQQANTRQKIHEPVRRRRQLASEAVNNAALESMREMNAVYDQQVHREIAAQKELKVGSDDGGIASLCPTQPQPTHARIAHVVTVVACCRTAGTGKERRHACRTPKDAREQWHACGAAG